MSLMMFLTADERKTSLCSALLPEASMIVDDVIEVNLKDYETVIEAFLEALTHDEGVLYIGQMGHVGTPGVSDIDLFIICEDALYPAIRQKLRTLTESVPHAAYLFSHQAIILPLSLVPDRCTLFFSHMIDEHIERLRRRAPLFGDGTLFDDAEEPSAELNALTRMIWNSTLWQVLSRLPNRPARLRSLLLLLQQLTNHTAIDSLLMGRSADPVLRLGKQLRSEVLSSPEDRPKRVHTALEQMLACWEHAEQELHTWWTSEALQQPQIQDAFPEGIDAPGCYAHISSVLADTFTPHLSGFPTVRTTSLTLPWREAVETYTQAVERSKQVARSVGASDFDLFLGARKGIFPSPFNLAH